MELIDSYNFKLFSFIIIIWKNKTHILNIVLYFHLSVC